MTGKRRHHTLHPARRRAESARDYRMQLQASATRQIATGSLERREHDREPWEGSIRIAIQQRSTECVINQTAHVKTCDLSRGGFSFLHRQYIPRGAEITAELHNGQEKILVVGVVQSCRLDHGAMHRVGVRFQHIKR